MPTYQIACFECGNSKDTRLSFTQYDEMKNGSRTISCGICGKDMSIVFSPGNLGFNLKEGDSGGWVSKSLKENNYRKKRRLEMEQRERNHVFKPNLQPNYEGVETGTWREAQELARKEKGSESAGTFESLVAKETM